MRQRGRKSTAALTTWSPPATAARPEPLDGLSDEAKMVWHRTVDAMPADWFPPESHDLLAAYCRHVVDAEWLSREIDTARGAPEVDPARLNRLFSCRDREVAAARRLATSMRLTQQSARSAAAAATAKSSRPTGGPRPWDDAIASPPPGSDDE